MISGSVVVPFQKGPCGDGVEEIRSFLLPLLEEAKGWSLTSNAGRDDMIFDPPKFQIPKI